MISCNCSENYQNWIINFYGKNIFQLLNVVFGFHLKVMHAAWAAQCKKLQILQCFKQFFFTIPKFQNRLALNWLNQISSKFLSLFSVFCLPGNKCLLQILNKDHTACLVNNICRMLNNFCLKFGSAKSEQACSEIWV